MHPQIREFLQVAKQLRDSLPPHWHDDAVVDFDDAFAALTKPPLPPNPPPDWQKQARELVALIVSRNCDLCPQDGITACSCEYDAATALAAAYAGRPGVSND